MTRGCPDKSLAAFRSGSPWSCRAAGRSDPTKRGAMRRSRNVVCDRTGLPAPPSVPSTPRLSLEICRTERAVRLRDFWRKLSVRVAARRPRGPTRWARAAFSHWLARGTTWRRIFVSCRRKPSSRRAELREMIGEAVDFDRINSGVVRLGARSSEPDDRRRDVLRQ